MMFFIQLLNIILIIISKFPVKFCCCNRCRYLNTSCSYKKLILFQCIYDFSSDTFSMEFWQNKNRQQNAFCLTSPGNFSYNGVNASTCSLCRHSASPSVTNFNSINSLIHAPLPRKKNRTKHSLSSAIIPIYDVIYIKHITYILVLCTRLIDLPAISQCIKLAKLITQYVYNTCTYNVLNVSSDSFVCPPCDDICSIILYYKSE